MSLFDLPNEEALKLHMEKKAFPTGKAFWFHIFFILLWHGSKNGAASRQGCYISWA